MCPSSTLPEPCSPRPLPRERSVLYRRHAVTFCAAGSGPYEGPRTAGLRISEHLPAHLPCSRLALPRSPPLCYRHVAGLPPFLKALPLLASAAAFALAVLSERPAFLPAARRTATWTTLWLAWQALSALWTPPAYRWTTLWPVLTGAAALAMAAGVASDPRRRRGLAWTLTGSGLALAVYAANLLSGGGVERLLGVTWEGLPIDHLPFGNRNLAALLLSALLPLAVLRRAWIPAALLGVLWATDGLAPSWAPRRRGDRPDPRRPDRGAGSRHRPYRHDGALAWVGPSPASAQWRLKTSAASGPGLKGFRGWRLRPDGHGAGASGS